MFYSELMRYSALIYMIILFFKQICQLFMRDMNPRFTSLWMQTGTLVLILFKSVTLKKARIPHPSRWQEFNRYLLNSITNQSNYCPHAHMPYPVLQEYDTKNFAKTLLISTCHYAALKHKLQWEIQFSYLSVLTDKITFIWRCSLIWALIHFFF